MKCKNNVLRAVLVAGAAFVGVAGASSQTFAATYTTASSTGTIAVSSTVIASCTITTTAAIFGTYTAATTSANTFTGTVVPTCTSTTPYQVVMNAGTTTGATVSQRLMSDGAGDALNYNIYTNVSLANVWGDGTTGTPVTGTGNGSAQSISYYGSVPGGQYVVPGNYTDTVTVTVQW